MALSQWKPVRVSIFDATDDRQQEQKVYTFNPHRTLADSLEIRVYSFGLPVVPSGTSVTRYNWNKHGRFHIIHDPFPEIAMLFRLALAKEGDNPNPKIE
jgi:hypothetical protein